MSLSEEQDFSAGKVDRRLWRRLYGYALRNRGMVAAILIILVVVAFIDVLYPLFTSYAIDRLIVPRSTDGLVPFAAAYVAAIVLQGLGVVAFINVCGKLEMRMAYDIRQDTFVKLQSLSFSFYDRTPVGYIMARMISDVSRLSELVAWSFVDVLWSLIYIVGSFVSLCLLSWRLALVVFAVLPPLAWISIRLQKRMLRYQRQARKENSKITGAFNEGIMGAITTKTLVREDANEREFRQLTTALKHVSIQSALVNAAFFPIIISFGAVGTGLALTLGGAGVIDGEAAWIGGISAGVLVAFISYSTQLFDPIQQMAAILAELLGAQASAERVLSLMDTKPDIVDTPEAIQKYGDILHPKLESWEPVVGNVTFSHVAFSYRQGEAVLSDFSLDVPAGQTIALVGETGAGKSTIVNLLCRFYEPTSGQVLIDGVDYRQRSQLWLQSSLGYVLQSPHLFSGTIGDNIRFGKPEATDAEVHEAARLVNADAFILRQPAGYDTQVGEGGALLSTGQKQLLCFARVVLKNPRIFVLDEATSSVDTETERLIQRAITLIVSGRTSLIVAHRLSTVRSADRILAVREGRIVESGDHEALMARRGYYYELYTQQFREQETQASLSDARVGAGGAAAKP